MRHPGKVASGPSRVGGRSRLLGFSEVKRCLHVRPPLAPRSLGHLCITTFAPNATVVVTIGDSSGRAVEKSGARRLVQDVVVADNVLPPVLRVRRAPDPDVRKHGLASARGLVGDPHSLGNGRHRRRKASRAGAGAKSLKVAGCPWVCECTRASREDHRSECYDFSYHQGGVT